MGPISALGFSALMVLLIFWIWTSGHWFTSPWNCLPWILNTLSFLNSKCGITAVLRMLDISYNQVRCLYCNHFIAITSSSFNDPCFPFIVKHFDFFQLKLYLDQGRDFRTQFQLGNGALFGASYIQVWYWWFISWVYLVLF